MQTLAFATTAYAADQTAPWHGPWNGPGPWWPLFPFLWLLLLITVVATFGVLGRRRFGRLQAQAGQRAGEARLAERYAAGEMDEQEYERRLATLRRLGAP
jgi:putative membrane protein